MSAYWASCQIYWRSQRLPDLWGKQAMGIRKLVLNHEEWVSQKKGCWMKQEDEHRGAVADIGRDPSHFLLSRTHIPHPYWCVSVEAGKVPFCCHWGWDAGTSSRVAKLCSGKICRRPEAFWGRHLQEAAAHTERKTRQKGEVLFSTETHHTSSTSPTEFLSAWWFGKWIHGLTHQPCKLLNPWWNCCQL